MARRMLIDASHPEETRVVVVDGTRLEEFDFETATRKPLKGNIYLAKVIRIEPSLQAAFVEYGGNRHGFLAFSEIHPDYYQIPVADRERLIAEQQRLAAEADEDHEPRRRGRVDRTDIEDARAENRVEAQVEQAVEETMVSETPASETPPAEMGGEAPSDPPVEPLVAEAVPVETFGAATPAEAAPAAEAPPAVEPEPVPQAQAAEIASERIEGPADETEPADAQAAHDVAEEHAEGDAPVDAAVVSTEPATEPVSDLAEAPQPEVTVETLGGDDAVEQRETRERRRRNPIRQYKIQEVIKRRQILLVQVVKEERGNKGAALTTYLSLAGRYSVLMPNAGRGGGISRKISNPADRKRMKEVLGELDVPQGMGVILRTAGLERSTIDIKRDYEYLSRLWDSIRELTMRSTAPALIYEEGDLIKRSLRDVYDTDIAQVLVEGETGFTAASEFMRQLVPHQANKVELYKEPIPLFHRYQVESQFDAMHSPVVQLRSGGYIVINPTEALVAIDVNSGRSTKERNIEETALRTNIEASEEVARQVRLRDLAGLIVIDFIDMEETRHQRQVEHKVKDAMRNDRARIQIGRISAFGLLEMSRQRLRPSLLEHSTEICPHCAGTGRIRSIESAALHALRAIEEEGVRKRAGEIVVSVPPNVALYLLNQKRHTLSEIEKRYGITVSIEADDELHAADCEIERVRGHRGDRDRPAQELARASYDEVSGEARPMADEVDPLDVREPAMAGEAGGERGEDDEGSRRRRRRRRRRPRRDGEGDTADRPQAAAGEEYAADEPAYDHGHDHGPNGAAADDHGDQGDEPREGEAVQADGERAPDGNGDGDRRRRRGRRGGRRRRRENGEGDAGDHAPREHAHHDQGHYDQGHREEYRAAEPNGSDSPHEEAPAPAPMDHMPVDQMAGEHMPVEHAPYDPGPPVNVEATPPPPPPPAPPVVASAPQPEPPPPPPPVPVIEAPPEKPKRGWWRR
ncbi:MAG TPA: Rne/Rng family ribonuclease [Reyranella sp.]|nr:Rne/Rng family ribonuclease [Reyranella sp.]